MSEAYSPEQFETPKEEIMSIIFELEAEALARLEELDKSAPNLVQHLVAKTDHLSKVAKAAGHLTGIRTVAEALQNIE